MGGREGGGQDEEEAGTVAGRVEGHSYAGLSVHGHIHHAECPPVLWAGT